MVAVVPQPSPSLRLRLKHLERRHGGGRGPGGRGGGVDERSGRVHEITDQTVRPRHVRSAGAQGFAERPHMEGDAGLHPEVFQRAASMKTHHAGAVRVVHHQPRAVPLRERDQFRKGRQIAIHAEYPVGHDQRLAVRGASGKQRIELRAVLPAYVLHVAQPVVDEPELVAT